MTAQPAHPNPCPPACHTPNPPWWCDCLDPVPIDNYWFILAGMGVALVWWHFWKLKKMEQPVSSSVNLTENQIAEWIRVEDRLPEPLETVWLTNGKGWVALGCLVDTPDGWHWAQSNGIIYLENGSIVAECESDDLDVVYWHPVPKVPNINSK